MTESRLGKGLAALLGEELSKGVDAGDTAVAVEAISPNPFQPRAEFDAEALEELATSIRVNGLLQPIVVRPVEDAYEIVAGERRFRAIQTLGWVTVPAIVRPLTDDQMLVVALVENLQRENLSVLEEAEGYQRLVSKFGFTQEQVAQQVGRSRAAVANTIRLTQLPSAVQTLIRADLLSAGHGRALLRLKPKRFQEQFAERAAGERWSVRETEARVKRQLEDGLGWEGEWLGEERGLRIGRERDEGAANRREKQEEVEVDPVFGKAEVLLERKLGAYVRIKVRPNGRGDIAVHFHNMGDLERLLGLVGGDALLEELGQ